MEFNSVRFNWAILISVPIFVYRNDKLTQVISVLGVEYWPNFGGLHIGYFLTWVGIAVVFASAYLAMRKSIMENESNEMGESD